MLSPHEFYIDYLSLLFQMGIADAILDLVSSGTTLKENNLKEIEGGIVLESQVIYLGPCQASDFVVSRMLLKEGLQASAFVTQLILHFVLITSLSCNILQAVLVASRKALIQRKGALDITDRKSTRLNSSHAIPSRMPSSA